MAEIPDRVWLSEGKAHHFGVGPRFDYTIEYRRVHTCVWRNTGRDGDNVIYTRDCVGIDMTIEWPGMQAMTHWHYCNYCGGRIEAKEHDNATNE